MGSDCRRHHCTGGVGSGILRLRRGTDTVPKTVEELNGFRCVLCGARCARPDERRPESSRVATQSLLRQSPVMRQPDRCDGQGASARRRHPDACRRRTACEAPISSRLASLVTRTTSDAGTLAVRESLFDGKFQSPKTRKARRTIPLGPNAIAALESHRQRSTRTAPEDLVFATRGPFLRQR